jgi:steroid 5-alpha reductase family enzyme
VSETPRPNTKHRGELTRRAHSKSEDYRWEVVRARMPAWQFKILNLVFVSVIQNILLLVAELPQYLLLTLHLSSKSFPSPPLGLADYTLSAVFVAILAVEMLADNEQQRYQALKAEGLKKGEGQRSEKEKAAIARGFVTGGLWSWSRHPVRRSPSLLSPRDQQHRD